MDILTQMMSKVKLLHEDARTAMYTEPLQILLTRAQTAELLQLSVRSVDYLVQQHKLESKKFGKRRLFLLESVEKLARTGCGRIVPKKKATSDGAK